MCSHGRRIVGIQLKTAAKAHRQPSDASLARKKSRRQIQHLSGRDLQLWSIGILVILVLTSGPLALVLPNLVWAPAGHPRRTFLSSAHFSLGRSR